MGYQIRYKAPRPLLTITEIIGTIRRLLEHGIAAVTPFPGEMSSIPKNCQAYVFGKWVFHFELEDDFMVLDSVRAPDGRYAKDFTIDPLDKLSNEELMDLRRVLDEAI